jgi:hypothetical protein
VIGVRRRPSCKKVCFDYNSVTSAPLSNLGIPISLMPVVDALQRFVIEKIRREDARQSAGRFEERDSPK